jgi:hypothetical protein
MTTIATNSWSITIGGGWIILMLIGMGLCFAFMLSSMWLMRNGRGWTMCGRWWQQETPRRDTLSAAPGQRPDRTVSTESEA